MTDQNDDPGRALVLLREYRRHAVDMVALLHRIEGSPVGAAALVSRDLAMARTRIDEAVMWAIRAVTNTDERIKYD